MSVSSSLLQKKIIDQQHLNHWFFATFRIVWLLDKNLTINSFFWREHLIFSKSSTLWSGFFYVSMGSLSNRFKQWMNLISRPSNHENFYNLKTIWLPGVTKLKFCQETKIFIDKVPFTLHLLVRVMYNRTNSKEQTLWTW